MEVRERESGEAVVEEGGDEGRGIEVAMLRALPLEDAPLFK